MTGLIAISLMGTLLLAFGVRLLSQSRSRAKLPPSIEDYSNARKALNVVSVEAAAITRIFSAEDLKFISCSSPRDVQRFFQKERRRLAIRWLRRTQNQIAHIVNLHLKLAGYTYALSPRAEVSLTARYFIFVISSYVVLMFLWLFGPFKSGNVISCMTRSVASFCDVLAIRLDEINRTRLSFPVSNLW